MTFDKQKWRDGQREAKPKHQVMSRVKPIADQRAETEKQTAPQPTNVVCVRRDGRKLRYWTDGSVRLERGE